MSRTLTITVQIELADDSRVPRRATLDNHIQIAVRAGLLGQLGLSEFKYDSWLIDWHYDYRQFGKRGKRQPPRKRLRRAVTTPGGDVVMLPREAAE